MKDKIILESMLKLEMLRFGIAPVDVRVDVKKQIQTDYNLCDKQFTLNHYQTQLELMKGVNKYGK